MCRLRIRRNCKPYNKAFKRDLARVAFSICVGFSGYGALR
nr:hypothetical protein [Vibrio parahaemolyticus]